MGTNEAISESDVSSDATVVASSEDLDADDDDDCLDDPDIGDFLYEALYNEHPVGVDVDLDVLAGA